MRPEPPIIAPPLTNEDRLRFVLNKLMVYCNCYKITETAHEITIEATFTKEKP